MQKLLARFNSSKGFTLIELLIVIAVLGVLAAVVLIGIDPVEQLAKGRDAGRKTTVSQVGKALQAYFTDQAAYPTTAQFTNSTATNRLVTGGYIQQVPTSQAPTPATVCTGGSLVNNFCYKVDAVNNQAVVYTHVESKAETLKGTCATVAANTWYVYTTIDGRGGTICQAAEPAANTSYTYY